MSFLSHIKRFFNIRYMQYYCCIHEYQTSSDLVSACTHSVNMHTWIISTLVLALSENSIVYFCGIPLKLTFYCRTPQVKLELCVCFRTSGTPAPIPRCGMWYTRVVTKPLDWASNPVKLHSVLNFVDRFISNHYQYPWKNLLPQQP